MMAEIDIVYASDRYYFPYVYVSIKTLYENNKSLTEIRVHYIEQDVDRHSLEGLRQLAREYGRDIDLIAFTIPREFDEILPTYGVASKTTYVKFWFASLFPEMDRVLYLDPDTMVMSRIDELYNLELGENLIAGVIENLPTYHMEASQMDMNDSYINGGMVLCNLRQWRKNHFEDKALERLKDVSHNLNYDQGILNELCKKATLVLHPKYNVLAEVFEFKSAEKIKKRYGFKNYYSQKMIDEAILYPVIIHFTGFLYGKPMSIKCTHPYAKYFQEILKNSPIDYELNRQNMEMSRIIRRFVLYHMPFRIYLALEKVLDIRRKRLL